MPHVIIEYTPRLETKIKSYNLLTKVHDVLVKSEFFSINAIKSRLRKTDDYVIGNKDPQQEDYIYIEVAILDGRETYKRQELSKLIHELLLVEFPEVFSLSCEIREIDKDTYSKN